MSDVPHLHRMPSSNTVPDPFLRNIPGNPMGIVQPFGKKPGLIDMDKSQNNYHNPGSEWTITEKVAIGEWGGGLDYEKYLTPGDLVFISPSESKPLGVIGAEEYPLLNIQCAQDLLRKIWASAERRVGPFVGAATRVVVARDDLDEPDAEEAKRSQRGDAARVSRYESYLFLPEYNMRDLFKAKGDMGDKKDAANLFRWMNIEGILDQLRPFGVIMNTPEASYDPLSMRLRNKPNDQKIVKNLVSVGLSGTVDMYNYWPGAAPNDYLFISIRRRYNNNTNREQGWEIQFPYRKEKHLSPYGQMYMGTSQLPERAAIYYVGQRLRKLPGEEAPADVEPVINNRNDGNVEGAVNAMRGYAKIRVLLAPLVRRT
jgi:hypothetical protein